MKENSKLTMAYWTAWRWPEVYSDDKWVIWLSRMIAIAMPVGIIGLTFITASASLGWIGATVIAVVMTAVILYITIKLFYPEYATVEDFDAREARVKEFFHGFPSHTAIPLIELEPGVWVAYGHVDASTFVDAIQHVVYAVTDEPLELVPLMNIEKSVGHLWATFSNPTEGHWHEGLDLCKNITENSFPITRVEV